MGIPNAGVNYNFNERYSLGARATFSGLYANNSEVTSFDDLGDLKNTKIRFNGLDLGVEHNYRIQPHLTMVVRTGYQLANRLEILDDENNLLYDFQPNGSMYVTMGLKFTMPNMR